MSDFEKRVRSVWSEFHRSTGILVADGLRDHIEEGVFLSEREDADNYPDVADSLVRNLEERLEEYRLVIAACLRKPKGDTGSLETAPSRVKMKSLERQMHLYLYVSGRLEMSDGRVSHGSWKRVTEMWNRDHPYDDMSPATLAREWNRAKMDRNVLDNAAILTQIYRDWHVERTESLRAVDVAQERTLLTPTPWIVAFLREMKLEQRFNRQESQE